MPRHDNFLAKQIVIAAIIPEDSHMPRIPISIYIQKAENLYAWCQEDKEALSAAGLDWKLAEDIPARAAALRVAEIAQGFGHSDMSLLEQAMEMADAMSELLARVNGDRADTNVAKIARDRAFSHLKEAVDALRDCGQYVFWNNEERLKGYSSSYLHRLRSRPKEQPAGTITDVPQLESIPQLKNPPATPPHPAH